VSCEAWLVDAFGEPKAVLKPGRIDVREPEPGEVAVEVDATGLNFLDVSVCRGAYVSQPELPLVPGAELAGRVAAVGDGVHTLRPGDRVAAMSPSALGAFAAAIVVPAVAAHRVPDAMPDKHAAAMCEGHVVGKAVVEGPG